MLCVLDYIFFNLNIMLLKFIHINTWRLSSFILITASSFVVYIFILPLMDI